MSKPPKHLSKRQDDNLVTASFLSASSLMSLRLGSRLLTFGLGQAMLRMASPRAYGTAAIQFELLLNTILFLSREGVRNALLRVKKPGREITNLSILPVVIGAPLALVTSLLYARNAGKEVQSQENFENAIAIYAFAAMTELLSEPMHNLAVSELRAGIRAIAEGLGLITKAVMTFLILYYDTQENMKGALALLAFAGGQLAYGSTVLLTYIVYYGPNTLLPKRSEDKRGKQPFFDPASLWLSMTMTSQSLVKHFLTEGDKLFLSYFSPLQDQGGYAIAVNYGSLIARIVFQPIEEASRLFFSKTLSNTHQNSEKQAENDTGPNSPTQESLIQAAKALTTLLSCQLSFSLIFLAFSTLYLPLGLQILLPAQYLATSAPKVLTTWCWYIPVLAINGGLEAFMSSVATTKDLNIQSWWMALFSAIYILSSVTFFRMEFGDRSLVYANILNLTARIIYCMSFATSYFSQHNARRALRWYRIYPRLPLITICLLSSGVVLASEKHFDIRTLLAAPGERGVWLLLDKQVFLHVSAGGALGLLCVGTWWITDGRQLIYSRRGKTD